MFVTLAEQIKINLERRCNLEYERGADFVTEAKERQAVATHRGMALQDVVSIFQNVNRMYWNILSTFSVLPMGRFGFQHSVDF